MEKFILAFDRELVIAEKRLNMERPIAVCRCESGCISFRSIRSRKECIVVPLTGDYGEVKMEEVHGKRLVRYLPLVKCSQQMLFI